MAQEKEKIKGIILEKEKIIDIDSFLGKKTNWIPKWACFWWREISIEY